MMEVILFLMFQMPLAPKRKETTIMPLIDSPSGYLATGPS
jgi:hypothetical protein